eukprot:CAMPEP_0116147190 /NCGR_PEP_ID=MMETSP0329-20121206/17617_1 /TAXON_ID=697910 /ORGANISM="Pseudo-nitzschia arenysensis, Strain B593" /LENGTH=1026 /DNA_ID=CAMNT_0003643091 /DNA_START=136 /DNA_END=3216 /DNA_ORIENTATION=+
MNDVGAADVVYQDSIHPPDLILASAENQSSVPDSPLSTPPDSPRRVLNTSDVKEEEKKEDDQDNAAAPLDEKADAIDDSKSTPDDEKMGQPAGDEVMTPVRPNQTTTNKTDKKVNDEHIEVVHLKPVVINEKRIVAHDAVSLGSDEPPSLSLVEKAKKRLTSKGLSFTEESETSSKPSSPAKPEDEEDLVVPSIEKADEPIINTVDIDEPPSLSRVEQAMQRTSMMVKKHNERKVVPTQSMDIPDTTTAAPLTATTTTDFSTKNSEAKLAALQRDIMNLKSSLSDMNTQLKEEQVEAPKVNDFNDIPFTKGPAPDSGDEDETMKASKKKNTDAIADHDITMETAESSVSQEKPSDEKIDTSFREMTPKKDLQGSEKSAAWLEQELSRRAGVKREINGAIEARGASDSECDELSGYQKPIVNELPSITSPPELQNSVSTMDEEVAAITANGGRDFSAPSEEVQYPAGIEEKISRKLDYGDLEEQPDDETMDELMGPSKASRNFEGFKPVSDYQDIQHEMKKFASQTREALREQSFTDVIEDPSSMAVPDAFSSPIAIDRSDEDHTDFQMNAIANQGVVNENAESISINFAALEAGKVPKMLISMDSFDGIASGDIFLSLLSENTGRAETSAAATWADRVHGAIWRARRMRKRTSPQVAHPPAPLMMGGSQTVESVQKAALMHLKRNEIDDAINLVEGIVFAYYSYFERSLSLREKGAGSAEIDFKPYIGMGLHNLGILNLLKGDYGEALSYFTRAVENRKINLGENHPHYISSLVRLAVCRYALNEFAEAHAGLEEALACAKKRASSTLEGRLQVAEIQNNLGCLAYMSGQPATAATYFRDSMDIQFSALTDSLYLGNAISGQSISLNISMARANIGFIKLVTKDLAVAITALENALMEQQILLKGLDETLVSTMDHLALSNLLVGSQEKAALMYNRILTLQQQQYGPSDKRCLITVEKMNMVQGKGIHYEGAIEKLRKTFSVEPAAMKASPKKAPRSHSKERKLQKSGSKTKRKKGFKALTSMMKK